jgi:hypothetical protein
MSDNGFKIMGIHTGGNDIQKCKKHAINSKTACSSTVTLVNKL